MFSCNLEIQEDHSLFQLYLLIELCILFITNGSEPSEEQRHDPGDEGGPGHLHPAAADSALQVGVVTPVRVAHTPVHDQGHYNTMNKCFTHLCSFSLYFHPSVKFSDCSHLYSRHLLPSSSVAPYSSGNSFRAANEMNTIHYN